MFQPDALLPRISHLGLTLLRSLFAIHSDSASSLAPTALDLLMPTDAWLGAVELGPQPRGRD